MKLATFLIKHHFTKEEAKIAADYLKAWALLADFRNTVMELKSISLGINKTVFSIVILLGYFYNDNFIQKSN